jgi:hypothetical protein
MADRDRGPIYSGGWAYVSIVSALPGLSVDVRLALAVQFLLFEAGAVVLVVWYDLWCGLPVATTAIAIATAGSGLMVYLSDRLRDRSPPEPYRRQLFDSSIDVVMAVLAFVALATYLLVDIRGAGAGFLERLLGRFPPVPVVYFALLVGWDLCYRIGTGWWASVTGLWRTVAFGGRFDERTRRSYVRLDALTIAFAGLQLLLVPFLWTDRFLSVVVLGHVGMVFLVSSLSVALQLRR